MHFFSEGQSKFIYRSLKHASEILSKQHTTAFTMNYIERRIVCVLAIISIIRNLNFV